jgi:hypothetical protein
MLDSLPKVSLSAQPLLHPVAEIQKNTFLSEEQNELQQASNMFGLHMATRLAFERQALSSFRRLPGSGLRSGLIGLEAALGRDEVVDFSDLHEVGAGDADIFTRASIHLTMQ